MNDPEFYRRRQKAVVFVGFMLFSLLLFMIQLWLFVAVLANLLGGHTALAIPAAAASIAILLVNVWMLKGQSIVGKSG